jgi:hypothetical protein
MRKILIGILTILLIVMAVLVITKGLTIGNFKILSVKQIIEGNDKLTAEISETEKLIRSNYPTELETLDSTVSSLLAAKEEYQDLADVSTKSEINKATTVETYTVEFLWTRLGRHATAEGVYLSYTPTNNSIKFTVSGDYIPILSFVSAIENDSKLGFRIENFKLIPGGNNLQATFETRNINIKTEGVNTAVQSTTITESAPTNTTDTNTQNTNSTTETTQP